jgi:hypothetical protein
MLTEAQTAKVAELEKRIEYARNEYWRAAIEYKPGSLEVHLAFLDWQTEERNLTGYLGNLI